MSKWTELEQVTVNGVALVIKERSDLRNQQGALEYMIDAYCDAKLVHSERCTQSKWLGHCYGQLLLPEIANTAKRAYSSAANSTTQSHPPNTTNG